MNFGKFEKVENLPNGGNLNKKVRFLGSVFNRLYKKKRLFIRKRCSFKKKNNIYI